MKGRKPLGQEREVRPHSHPQSTGTPPQTLVSNRQGMQLPDPLRKSDGKEKGSLKLFCEITATETKLKPAGGTVLATATSYLQSLFDY